MSKPVRYTLEKAMRFLQDNVELFPKLEKSHQFYLTEMFLKTGMSHRKHNIYKGFSSFSYQEIDGWFGRNKFNRVNELLNMFEIIGTWRKSNKKMGFTKGYRLTLFFVKLKEKYFKDCTQLSDVINQKGNIMRKQTIENLNEFVTKTSQRETEVKHTIIINHKKLDELCHDIAILGDENLLNDARLIRQYSHLKPLGERLLNQRYCMSGSGRLYAKDTNLQNCRKIIKIAALSGYYEYDFENCHFSIFDQLAKNIGVECINIQYYLKHKQEIRLLIAKDLNLEIPIVKQVLISVMYGASRSTNEEHAIPKLLGINKAKELYKHPFFSNLVDELKIVGNKIIHKWEQKTEKRLYNHMNKFIDVGKAGRFLLAHIIQGYESAMLHIAMHLNEGNIILLQHDGFVTCQPINEEQLLNEIYHDMGMKMTLSCETLFYD